MNSELWSVSDGMIMRWNSPFYLSALQFCVDRHKHRTTKYCTPRCASKKKDQQNHFCIKGHIITYKCYKLYKSEQCYARYVGSNWLSLPQCLTVT